jgi:hypothetical protein
LRVALERRGVSCEAPEYLRGPHAFHAFVLWSTARRCWEDHYAFLDRALARDEPAAALPFAGAQQPGAAA